MSIARPFGKEHGQLQDKSVGESMSAASHDLADVTGRRCPKDGYMPKRSRIIVATGNVCTLGDGKNRIPTGIITSDLVGRTRIFEQQFDDCGIDIVGIQEGRTPENQIVLGAKYTRYISGANAAGSYGTQCWVRHSLKHSLLYIRPHCPRLLELTINIEGANAPLTCIVAHVPHSGDLRAAGRFWERLAHVVSAAKLRCRNTELLSSLMPIQKLALCNHTPLGFVIGRWKMRMERCFGSSLRLQGSSRPPRSSLWGSHGLALAGIDRVSTM